jgi:MFS family permease
MVRLLPFVFLGPIGGVIADRYERTQVLVIGAIIQAMIMCGITVAVGQRGPAIVVILLAGLNTAAAAPSRPAALAMMPGIVGEKGLAPGNALLHTVQDVGVVGGPALGAAILAVGSPAEAFAFNALSFLVSGVTISAMKSRSRGLNEEVQSPLAQFFDGLRAVRSTPYVPILTWLTFVGAFTYGAQTVQLVIYVQERLHLQADGYGYLLAAAGAGGVLGATISNRMASRRRIMVPLVISSIAFVGSQLGFAGVEITGVAIAVGVVSGLGMVVADVISETAISRTASNEVMGRIFGAYDGISVGAMVLGALVSAPLVHVMGVRSSLVVLGAVACIGILAAAPVLAGLDRVSTAVVDALKPRLDVLSQLSIFDGASQVALERLAKAATELTVGTGMVIVAQGEPADAFYVCVQGEVAVTSTGEAGGEPRLLRTLGGGTYFGEIGLIEHIPRTATVRATMDSTLLRIDGETFLDALNEAPAGRLAAAEGVRRGLARTHPSLPAEHATELASS